jgi:hypothetical protein
MFELGQEIYYCDVKNGVQKGVVLGYSVNEQGHDVYSVKNGQTYVVVFKSYCYLTEEEAQKELDRIKPLNDKIIELRDKCNAEIDALLVEIYGKPAYEHLTLKAEKPE